MANLICPLLSANDEGKDILCLEEGCAWFIDEYHAAVANGRRGCAMAVLAHKGINTMVDLRYGIEALNMTVGNIIHNI